MSDRVREEVIDLAAQKKKRSSSHATTKGKRSQPTKKAGGDDFQFMKKQSIRKARIRRNRLILLFLGVFLVVGIFSIRMILSLGAGMDTFYEGISVDGLNLKGYSKQEATDKVRQLGEQKLQASTLRFSFGEQEFTISPAQIGAYLDIEDQIELAWQKGRQGNLFKRQAEVDMLKRKPYQAITSMTYSSEALTKKIQEEVKNKVDMPATDAKIDFDPSREEKFRFLDEQVGREVSLEELVTQAVSVLDGRMRGTIAVVTTPLYPAIKRDDLAVATTRIKRVNTSLGTSKDERIHNIKLALSKFNAMVIMPSEEVSFNQVTGPRGLEQGYQNAGVILDDEIVDGPGGGVCQVSTTLYQAVVKSGLQVTTRTKHSLPISYVPLGTDAAVAYDYKDLAFKNNTDTPIFLQCEVSGANVSVTVYGRALDEGVDIAIVNEILETIPAPDVQLLPDTKGEYVKYTDETYIKKKSRLGYKVKTYAVWTKNGTEFKRDQLSNDYYKEVQGVTYVGITPRPQAASTVPIIPANNTND